MKTILGYVVANFEVASSGSFRDIQTKIISRTTEAAVETDIDDSIKRKRIQVSLKNVLEKRTQQ